MQRSRKGQALTITRSAELAGQFGREYAERLFGRETVESLPKFVRGPKAGLPRGHVIWLRTTSAGYHVNAGRAVAEGTTVRAWIGEGAYTPQGQASRGTWLGRTQDVCGSMCLLGEENQER